MKTTIDIPETLYKRAKIRAVEQGTSLQSLVLQALERAMERPALVAEQKASYWAGRKLLPGFQRVAARGDLGCGTDSTHIISEDRTTRYV